MKYIDADKLIAEIERYEKTAIDAYNPHGEDADFWYGRVTAFEYLKTFIHSLQQEQPDAEKDLALTCEDVAYIVDTFYIVEGSVKEKCEEVLRRFNEYKKLV